MEVRTLRLSDRPGLSLNRSTDLYRGGGYDTRGVLSVIPKMPLRSQLEPDAMRADHTSITSE